MNLSRRTSLTALAACCSVAAIAPSTASAVKVVTYNAEISGQVDWSHSQHIAGADYSFSSGGWFTWNTLVNAGQLKFVDGYLTGVVAHGTGQQYPSGQATAEHHDKETGTQSGACELDNQQHDGAAAAVGKPEWAAWNDETAVVSLSESLVDLHWKCEGHAQPTVPDVFGAEPLEHDDTTGNRPLDATFTIPKEIVGFGKIIQNVEGPPAPSAGYCPERWYDGVTKCTFRWKGAVTLTKTGEQTLGDPPAESTDVVPAPAPPAKTNTASDSELEELAPLVLPTTTATTDAKASKVSFTATCPSGCSGSAALTVGGPARGSAAAAAGAKPVARMAFRVKPGKARRVTLKLPAKARRALSRAGRGTLRVTLKRSGQVAVIKTLKVKVPRR